MGRRGAAARRQHAGDGMQAQGRACSRLVTLPFLPAASPLPPSHLGTGGKATRLHAAPALLGLGRLDA